MRGLVMVMAVLSTGGCASRALPDSAEMPEVEPPPVVAYAGCVLDLDSPMALHLEAPHFTECPAGEAACTLPAFCRGGGDRWSAAEAAYDGNVDAEEIDDNMDGQTFTLRLFGDPGAHGPGSVSFSMADYVCVDSQTSPTSSFRYDSGGRWHVTFAIQCHNETKPLFMVEGTASGPLQKTN